LNTSLDCFGCILRQAFEASRHVSADESIHEAIIRRSCRIISEADTSQPSPYTIGMIHRVVRQVTGQADPYKAARRICNDAGLAVYDQMKSEINKAASPLEMAIRMAIAANVIDFVVDPSAEKTNILETMDKALTSGEPLDGIGEFEEALHNAGKVLYLGDNAGEIVFDRLLIERLPVDKICYVVRGGPVVNDVTEDDARTTGLADLVEIIDNGSDLPGTVISQCSPTFLKRFAEADLVISKGQGNYECLEDYNKKIFFLFSAKCGVIGDHLGCKMGEMLFQGSGSRGIQV
jgi:damage-control phosphatase, subfamily I